MIGITSSTGAQAQEPNTHAPMPLIPAMRFPFPGRSCLFGRAQTASFSTYGLKQPRRSVPNRLSAGFGSFQNWCWASLQRNTWSSVDTAQRSMQGPTNQEALPFSSMFLFSQPCRACGCCADVKLKHQTALYVPNFSFPISQYAHTRTPSYTCTHTQGCTLSHTWTHTHMHTQMCICLLLGPIEHTR